MILTANDISKKYRRKSKTANFFYAVENACIEIEEGKITEIVGRSGSGKTTFVSMLAGLLRPSSGTVTFAGKNIYELDDKELSILRNENFGVVPQGQTAIDSLTVLENVKLPYALYKKDDEADAYAKELLDKVGISELEDVYPNELSGGEIKRLAIARALINRPKILFADEPTADLDDENTESVLKLFKELAEEGMAVVMITHEIGARAYADFIYKMNAGKLDKEN